MICDFCFEFGGLFEPWMICGPASFDKRGQSDLKDSLQSLLSLCIVSLIKFEWSEIQIQTIFMDQFSQSDRRKSWYLNNELLRYSDLIVEWSFVIAAIWIMDKKYFIQTMFTASKPKAMTRIKNCRYCL